MVTRFVTATDPINIALAHNRWANRETAHASTSLTEAQFHQRFDMGLGTLHDTLVHIAEAMKGWTNLLAHRSYGPRPKSIKFDPPAIVSLLETAANELEANARIVPLDEVLTHERGGKVHSFTRGAILIHITTHGMHHRAQCLNMLRHIYAEAGVETPLPRSSVMEWTQLETPV